jgi:aminocarboxymuconate-semialdehyde decarboxylase
MRLIDMDTHFAPADEFAHVPEEFKYVVPAWLPHGAGRVAVVAPSRHQPTRKSGPLVPRVRERGDFDADARLADMDAMGVEKQLLNPEFTQYAFETEPRLAAAMCRSANTAVANVLKAHPDRFIGAAMLPTQNVLACLEEAKRAHDAGFQTFFMKGGQGGRNFDDQYFWPLYDFANEHGIPIVVHSTSKDPGCIADIERLGAHWGITVATVSDFVLITCSLIYGGIFDTFPKLKFCLAELGATWMLWLWDRLSLTYEVGRGSRALTKKHPTAYLASNIYLTVDPTEQSLGHLCDRISSKNLMLGTDYPHGDITGRGHTADRVAELRRTHIDLLLEREDLSPETKENIAWKNALEFLGDRVA